ncbi:MAG TPA: hypothetical protein V7792_00695 [Candidatus Azoamicus sp. OHIO2]
MLFNKKNLTTILNTYLVGGFIRDKFIGINNTEKDWLITKINFETMFKFGFKLVGRDFPVFLHAITKEEYALARKDRKTKKGHAGFKCFFSKNINLKNDIYRRDLTCNTFILHSTGSLTDILNAQTDLKNKTLKHISFHFSDDPLRVFRLARFWNKYYNKGFLISSHTYFLIKNLVAKNNLLQLSNERIIKEFHLALSFQTPAYFLNFLYQTKSLYQVFNDIHLLIEFSIIKSFNIYLNLWIQLCNIYIKTYTNNTHIKLLLLFFKLKTAIFYKTSYKSKLNIKKLYSYYKDKLLLSKKYLGYITNLTIVNFLFHKILQNNNNTLNMLKKITQSKNKLVILNNLYICDINNRINDHISFFYKKYIILEILNSLTYIKLNNRDKFNKNDTITYESKINTMFYTFKKNILNYIS